VTKTGEKTSHPKKIDRKEKYSYPKNTEKVTKKGEN